MEQPPVIPQTEQRTSLFPLWLAVGANAANFLLSIQFYFVPSGSNIRPMAWASLVGCIAVGGFVALPFVLPAIRQRHRRFRAWLTVVLAITPFPLASAMLHHAAGMRGFFLAP
jgi:hypothetical protein